jgi:hypothetical protein
MRASEEAAGAERWASLRLRGGASKSCGRGVPRLVYTKVLDPSPTAGGEFFFRHGTISYQFH